MNSNNYEPGKYRNETLTLLEIILLVDIQKKNNKKRAPPARIIRTPK